MAARPRLIRREMMALRIAFAVVLVLGGSRTLAQTEADPRSLIGDWAGVATLIGARAAASRGSYTLTIERVEGANIYGSVATSGRGPAVTFVGTLRGNTLTFYTGRFETQLTVAGDRMYGVRRAGADSDSLEVHLTKVDRK